MNTRRKLIATFGAGMLLTPVRIVAQQMSRVHRVGYLGPTSADFAKHRIEAWRAGLRQLGYVEGRNLIIDFRWADGRYALLPKLAAELVATKVEVIVTHGAPGTRAAKQATATIPIVMASAGDPVASGLIASLARPGTNVTGSTFFQAELAAKRLEVLKETFPRLKRVAVLMNEGNAVMGPIAKEMQQTAIALQLDLQSVGLRVPEDFAKAFAQVVRSKNEALVTLEDAMLTDNVKKVADFGLKQRVLTIGLPELVEAGGLLSYGASHVEMFRRAAYFVDRILKGARLADLPVERASKFELGVNMKTAKALGLTIPEAVLLRADKVIE